MRVVVLGDVVGRSGRLAVATAMDTIRRRYSPNLVVINGENASGGFGITEANADELFAAGAHVITTGNHVWKHPEAIGLLARRREIIRPINAPSGQPGFGVVDVEGHSGRCRVVNVSGRLFMDPIYDCPFAALDTVVGSGTPKDQGFDALVVDVHGEATSEKTGVGYYLDGRASVVVGTHTHVPTADARILPAGTGFQTDLGMCGDYDSLIGMGVSGGLGQLTGLLPRPRLKPADGVGTVAGVVAEVDPATGLAVGIVPIRLGGVLSASLPGLPSDGREPNREG